MIVEGFRIILYNTTVGLVLKCVFATRGSEGFYESVKEACKELDLQREALGFMPRDTGIRNSPRGFAKGTAGKHWGK